METIREEITDLGVYNDVFNKRLKINHCSEITSYKLNEIKKYAKEIGTGKIIGYCKSENWEPYIENGFVIEGVISNFFSGKTALIMSFFVDKKRSKLKSINDKNKIIKMCREKSNTFNLTNKSTGYHIRNAVEGDAKEMAELFGRIFKTYPTPMHDAEFIVDKMRDNVLYKVAVGKEGILGVTSAEMDFENHNAEITDCVVNPEFESKGLLSEMVYFLEKDLIKMGFISLYSLARATSYGINIVLSKHNYRYSGRMINNCNICGGFEDMNLWEKPIL